MKAIVIDATAREVNGIEVDLKNLEAALQTKRDKIVPLDLTEVRVNNNLLFVYDKNGVLKHPASVFYFEGLGNPIFGRGLVLGLQYNLTPTSTPLTVRDVEGMVGFHG